MLVERIKEIYDLQKHCVIVCGEGIVDEKGEELGAEHASTDPAGNVILSGASEALRAVLIRRLGDDYFTASGGTSRRGPRSSRVNSGTPSAAAGRSCSTASTRRNSAATRWTCCSRA